MSSAAPNPDSNYPRGDTGARSTDKIVVYHHSHLFYWWPVWLLGFIFAGITYFDNMHLALVPDNTEAVENRKVDVDGKGKMEKRNVLILDKDKEHWKRVNVEGQHEIVQPTIFMPHYKSLGSVFVVVLLLVIAITNVSVRGLWSVLVIVVVIMLTIIFWAAGWWETIFHRVNQLSIFINMGAYLLISTVLFFLWFINFFFLDRQTYMIFTPGQVRIRQDIGGEELIYDVSGMVVQKARNDMFRHWILGFGSGDLVIKPVGVAHPIEFSNVLFVGSMVAKIENMVKEKVIVRESEQKPPNA